ncbi:5-formyltetrahydrofolate cyclo-ligase [Prevotella sp. E13-17]|nr:5-formyltetrahydrofolate cyclo-ligase [Prevotella sp. E13-17]
MREAKRQHQSQLTRMSAEVVERLKPLVAHSSQILAYWPLSDEVDIRPLVNLLIAQGKAVVLPKVTGTITMELRRYSSPDDLREGSYHIMEPMGELFTDYEKIDTVLVPGMAFDAAGHRLGRGKGYYDRFLPRLSHARKIGVCFPFQRVPEVPTDEHDVMVDDVVG